jgi:hypothetical protein
MVMAIAAAIAAAIYSVVTYPVAIKSSQYRARPHLNQREDGVAQSPE